VSTTPAYGARIERAPTEVVLEFTEQVSLIRGGVRLLNADGRELPTAEPRVSGRRLTLPLPADLARGGYVVSWRVVSSDTHPVAGAFTFGIGAEPAGATAVDAGTRSVPRSVVVALAVYRWLGFVGTALLVGGGVFLLAIWPAGRGSRRARRLVLAGWAMVASATLLGLLIQGPHVDARPLRDAFDTELLREGVAGRFGAAHLARLALLAVVLTPLRRLLQADAAPGPRAYGALGLAAVVLAGTYAGAGHAASGSFSALAMVSDGTHLLVMSLWAGGLVLLGACALRPGSGPTIRSALSRFSTLALGSVALLAVTGTLQAWREVGSLAGFVDTSYGRLVLAKITIFGGLLLLGGLAWLAVRRGPDPATRLRRIVPFEVAGVAVVLAVTAVLVNTPPGATAQAVAPPTPNPPAPAPRPGGAPRRCRSGRSTSC